MMLSYNENELGEFTQGLARNHFKAVAKANRRVLKSVYRTAWEIAKERYPALTKTASKGAAKSFAQQVITRRSGDEAAILASTNPYSMIHAVVGSKAPRRQKDIPVKRRVTVRYRIGTKRGKPLGKGQFIARKTGQNNAYPQVFAKIAGKFHRGSFSSLFHLLTFVENKRNLVKIAERTFYSSFGRGLDI